LVGVVWGVGVVGVGGGGGGGGVLMA